MAALRGLAARRRHSSDAPPPGDEEIVAALYREYHRPLLAFVLRLTGGDRGWAEDVAQETMVRAWRSARTLDPDAGSLMPWLATVARRIVIDHRRSRDVRPPEVGDGPLENLPAADEVDGLLRKVMVAEALNSLSAAHRQILTETVLRDRTVNQAADALGIPVGTAKSRVYYALRALRVALEERGVTP
ncbi:sigma-70 family RNA polymerase sigma factor [Actinomadura rupiterrae]|uniref:sigma-70 family RNA polymerase sigma factor n=1 Tax=Actinomadura rupiterrae TaxID=559627 RepID=UPI0020A239CE|nr:sigma-70 family RNA polymerase sigma factor [Actinomadura rupiterrae]MCP2340109.1 RNA polymerase sigma-70 factor (ECF subfamily) [Actinomadura rupiterrae]